MAKTILGVDIGYDNLKLALVAGDTVKKTASVPMPRNMVRDGQIVSVESVGEMIRAAMKEHGLRARGAAFAFSNESVYVKSVTMPLMTADQLEYNLPFEFRDYITGEIRDYTFDYGMYSTDFKAEEPAAADSGFQGAALESAPTEGLYSAPPTMDMLAVAAPRTVVEEARAIMRKAGLKLVKAAPALSAYMQMIRRKEAKNTGAPHWYCILDLGYQSVRMYIFHGERHIVTRVLDIGLSVLDQVIADLYGVDIHLAHTYLMTGYDHCTSRQECLNSYDNIATELMRALNFLRFSNPDGNIEDAWLLGGGAKILPLQQAIADTLDLQIHPASDLLPGGNIQDAETFIEAIGITMD